MPNRLAILHYIVEFAPSADLPETVMQSIPLFFSQGQSTSAWLKALKNADAKVRRQAALALGQIGPESKAVIAGLDKALKDTHELVRRQAAESLGRMGGKARTAVPALARLLNDERDFVRQQAA